MDKGERFEKALRVWGAISLVVCLSAAFIVIGVVSVRLPALGASRLESLFGTLLAVAVSLLMVIAGLLVNLLAMIRRLLKARTEASAPD